MKISDIIRKQREFFATGKTRDLDFREQQLKKLRTAVKEHEAEVLGALHADLHKADVEAYVSEVGFLYEEIKYNLKHFRSWAKPKSVTTPLLQAVAKSKIYSEPLGITLILAPWNYPFQLLLAPLVGSLAAGNCSVLKPSELAPATSKIIAKICKAAFAEEVVACIEGGVETSTALLEQKFDHIFFTGGTQVGKVVMTAAAKHLTPVTLELGGKSPCIIDKNTDLDATARRVTWGKFFNAGQTCVAPDYVLIPKAMRDDFVSAMQKWTKTFFGEEPQKSTDYGRIINERHFDRLAKLIDEKYVVMGGKTSKPERYIAPTVLAGVPVTHKSMEEEIFGPILPVLGYDDLNEAIRFVNDRPKPLALYFFSNESSAEEQIVNEISFGGGCINDTLVHLSNPRLPFGGVGDSGIGNYHGQYGFDIFSHKKSVVRRSFLVDPMLRYPPYKDRLSLFKRLMG